MECLIHYLLMVGSIAKFGAKAHGQDSCSIEEYQRLEKVRVVLVSL